MTDFYSELFQSGSLRPWVTLIFAAIPQVRFDHRKDPDSSKFRYVKSMDHLVVPQQGTMQVVFEIYDEGGFRLTDILGTSPMAADWSESKYRLFFRYGYSSTSGAANKFKSAWHSAVIQNIEVRADGGGCSYTITAVDDLSYTTTNSVGTGTLKFPGIVSALRYLFEELQAGPDGDVFVFEAQEVEDDGVTREYHLDGMSKLQTAYAWMKDHVGKRDRKLQLTSVYDVDGNRRKIVLSEEPEKPSDVGGIARNMILPGWPEGGMQVFGHVVSRDLAAPAVIGFEPKFDFRNIVALNYVGTAPDSTRRSYSAAGPPGDNNRADRVYEEDDPISPERGGVSQKISGRTSQPLEEPSSARELLVQAVRHMNERVRPTIALTGLQADLTLVGMPGRGGPPNDWTHPLTFLGDGEPKRWVSLFVHTPYSISQEGPARFLVHRISMTRALSGPWFIVGVSHRITVDGGYTTVFNLQMFPTLGTDTVEQLKLSSSVPVTTTPPGD